MAGFFASAGCTPYSISKAAVNSLMECYYQALKPYNIGVSCLCPGGSKQTQYRRGHVHPAGTSEKHRVPVDAKTIEFESKVNALGMDP